MMVENQIIFCTLSLYALYINNNSKGWENDYGRNSVREDTQARFL